MHENFELQKSSCDLLSKKNIVWGKKQTNKSALKNSCGLWIRHEQFHPQLFRCWFLFFIAPCAIFCSSAKFAGTQMIPSFINLYLFYNFSCTDLDATVFGNTVTHKRSVTMFYLCFFLVERAFHLTYKRYCWPPGWWIPMSGLGRAVVGFARLGALIATVGVLRAWG